ncbi:MAG: carbon starvation protein A [bacterium]|jgi:carbon starvation protein
MNSLIPTFCAFLCMYIGYKYYSRYLAQRVFQLDDRNPTPAVSMGDGIDYVPAVKPVLFSHHFASIAGLSPIVGPAIAVIWGWLPAMLWLVIGAVLMGAVHDMAALVISIRHQGRSIGDVCESLIGRRARILFLFIIFIALALAMGMFTYLIATLLKFDAYPAASTPAILLIFLAMVLGTAMYKNVLGLRTVSVIGIIATFLFIWLGTIYPIMLGQNSWVIILLLYALCASVLPVWLLLQPRDYINTLSLYIGLGSLFIAVLIFAPTIVAPAVNTTVELPSMFPLLFVTIACGAVSGFHSIVSSGTTAKQLAKESDARPVGYGAMIAECGLGIIAVLACTAGVSTSQEWYAHYDGWSAGVLQGGMTFFVQGAGTFISWMGVPLEVATTFVALLIVSFALTTLDSGTRLLRYNLEEIGDTFNLEIFKNRYVSSTLAVATVAYFAVSKLGSDLWVLFGTVNQLLAALGLLAATVYLVRLQRNIWVTAVPMCFMFVTTLTAMILNLKGYVTDGKTALMIVGSIILVLVIGLIIEAILFYLRWRSGEGEVVASSPEPVEPA